MESQADFDGGICCVARADPMFFKPDERMTCEYMDLNEVEFEYVENEEMIAHIIQINADVAKVRVYTSTHSCCFPVSCSSFSPASVSLLQTHMPHVSPQKLKSCG